MTHEPTVADLLGTDCRDCAGRGYQPTARLKVRTCPRCAGSGTGPAGRFDPETRVLVIPTVRGPECRYLLNEVPGCNYHGRVFELCKLDRGTDPEADSYVMTVGADGHTMGCECRGYLRHGRCKHLSDVLDLLRAGLLDLPAELPPDPKVDPFAA